MADLIAAFEEEPRDSGVVPKTSPVMISFVFLFLLSVSSFVNILFFFFFSFVVS